MIIGLTSYVGAGKGEICKYLTEQHSFVFYSLSDILRESCMNKGIPLTRDNLIAEGERLRSQEGNDVLAQRTLKKIREGYDYVIDSIRRPEEVQKLREHPAFHLIHVKAAQRIRFRRILCRGRENDPKTWEGFLKLDEKDAHNPVKGGLRTQDTIALASYTLVNEKTLAELHASITAMLASFSRKP